MTILRGLDALEAAKSVLLAELSAGLSAEQVIPALRELEQFRNSLAMADHLLIGAAHEHRLAEQHCVSSVEKLLAQALRISYGDAKRRVRAAAAVGPRSSVLGEPMAPSRPELAAAQAEGAVSPDAVDIIERTLAKVEIFAPTQVTHTEKLLVEQARSFDPQDLGRVCDRVLDHVDPDGTKPRDAVQRDRRGLHLGRCRDGMTKVDGRLTPATAARVRAVLEPLAAPRPTLEPGPRGGEKVVPDDRTRDQRLHDALDEACARLLRAGDVPASGGTPATVILTMTEEQLRAAAPGPGRSSAPDPGGHSSADAWYGRSSMPGSDARPGDVGCGVRTAEASTGEVLSIAEALRVAVEAEIISVVMSASGQPLHLGRTRRFATLAQTQALIARDGGCSFPGCTIPPEWCERHHLISWAAGGRTDVSNLTLLCGYHHGHFVQAGWSCRLNADGLPEWLPPRWLARGRPPLVNRRILQRHGADRR